MAEHALLVLGLQILIGLLVSLGLYWIKRLDTNLKENSKDTHTITVNSARTDTKVDILVTRVDTIAKRTHDIEQRVTELNTRAAVARGAD
jgi:hypothetical protein